MYSVEFLNKQSPEVSPNLNKQQNTYPGKDITANVRHHGNCNCFLLVYQSWQLENKKHTYSWCKVSCHIHAQGFITVQELINYGYLFIFIIRKTVLRYWWIDKKPNQQLEDERVPLWEASNSPLSPAPRGDSETLDRIQTSLNEMDTFTTAQRTKDKLINSSISSIKH